MSADGLAKGGDGLGLGCLHELFDAAAERSPGAVAVRFRGRSTTYGHLRAWSDRIARSLVARSLAPGARVAVLLPNGPAFAAAVLGVLKAGAVLVPIDPCLSAERIELLFEEARPAAVVTTAEASPRVHITGASLSPFDTSPDNDRVQLPSVPSSSIAYLLFTSGSTGARKGVLTRHAGVTNLVRWVEAELELPEQSAILMRTAHVFDVWLFEFFWALGSGHRLVMAENTGTQDPTYLLRLIRDERVSGVNAVPSILRRLATEEGFTEIDHPISIISGGETLDSTLARKLLANPRVRLYNVYGPTEASIWSTMFRVIGSDLLDPIPIGMPIPPNSAYVLDPSQHVVPDGTPGELCISGVAVGAGYIDGESDHAPKFVEAIDGLEGGPFYRTNDRVRLRNDGNLVFLGRIDGHLKLNGIRVETLELERCLRLHDGVVDCAVTVKAVGDPPRDALIAYVVPADSSVTEASLRSYLVEALPSAMLQPAAFVLLPELPTLVSGKCAYADLPPPSRLPRLLDEPCQPPTSSIEKVLVDIWFDVLKVWPIGIDDDFYALGGDPLLAHDVVAAIADKVCPGVRRVVAGTLPSIRLLAAVLHPVMRSRASTSGTTFPAPEGHRNP